MNRQYVTDISDMLNDDLSNMGYDVNRITRDPETDVVRIMDCAQSHRIRFYRNLCETEAECNDPNRIPERIEWRFLLDNEISATNPAHRTLLRTVTEFDPSTGDPLAVNTQEINVGVTQFNIEYYETVGSNSNISPGCGSNVTNVRQFKVTLEVQSAEKIYSRSLAEGRYVRSVWEKRFTPANLQINTN
ncbi:hypothetical protein DYD21_02640 [Rhodohalobacter sp. SW132]|nr:hypothetical protein DYD21_02640 [Rhodohalobacter sp. SW132]